ncbi:MAG TPA: GspMb/PilO family protein [Patescibacteria group bacterium]|nr:GspMb/PilO family protein [Patescibacteria group bacterium]
MDYKRFSRYYRKLEPTLQRPEAKAYTMLTLSIFAIAIFGIAAIKPVFSNAATIYGEIQKREALNRKLEDKMKALETAEQIYREQISPVADSIIYVSLPKEPRLATLAVDIEKMALDTNVQVLSIVYQPVDLVESEQAVQTPAGAVTPPKPSKGKIPVSFSITVTGEYSQLLSFLDQFYRSKRMIFTDNVRVATIETKEQVQGQETITPSLSLTVKGDAYYQK